MSNDRFTSPRPAHIQPSKPLIVPTLKKETTIGTPISALPPLPGLNLPVFGNNVIRERKVREKKVKEVPAPYVPTVDSTLVCTDEEFIIKTRSSIIHDPGMKELFFANGGIEIYSRYGTLAQAFDALRRNKQARLTGKLSGINANSKPYERVSRPTSNVRVYVPGGTAADTMNVRERAQENARHRQENENWIRQPMVPQVQNKKIGRNGKTLTIVVRGDTHFFRGAKNEDITEV